LSTTTADTLRPSPRSADSGRIETPRRLGLIGLGLCVPLIWMLQHPYLGLVHDSCLYTLLALARLHPALSSDFFLKFGSQDTYTIFSPMFATAIRLLDLEPTAALGTLLSQAVFFWGAWLLARRVMSKEHALLALGLLAALPAVYGPQAMFAYIEGFLTPRQMAAGFALIGVAAFIDSRWLSGTAWLLAAMLLHPIMGVAGVAMVTMLYAVIPHPRLGPALLAGAFAVALAICWTTTSGPFTRLDPVWLHDINIGSSYLFVLSWSCADWLRAVPAATVLVVGLLTSRKPLVRNLCGAALATGCCGVLLTAVFCDLLRVQLFVEMQTWRWLWLGQVAAVVLLPAIMVECWGAGAATRPVTLILASVWIIGEDPLVLGVALLTVGCAAFAHPLARAPRKARLILIGACAVLAIALAMNFAPKLTLEPKFTLEPVLAPAPGPIVPWTEAWTKDGILYAIALSAAHWLVRQRPLPAFNVAVALGAALACAYFATPSWKTWSASYYNRTLFAALAPWRAAMRPEAEVIWPAIPVGAWYLLERPSYWSLHQAAGDIFSRSKAMESHRRGLSLLAASGGVAAGSTASSADSGIPGIATEKLTARGLVRACADPQLQFVVSWVVLGTTTFAPVTPDSSRPKHQLHLYRCADFRK
jgi:hypothetical protein